jgi:MFS family permease
VAPTFAGIAVAKTADDLGKSAFRPAWGALMTRISSYDRRNRALTMSWMSMGEDAGATLAPILAGFLWSAWGITALMGVRALLALGTEAYAILIARVPGAASAALQHPAASETSRLPTSPAAVPNADLQRDGVGGGL